MATARARPSGNAASPTYTDSALHVKIFPCSLVVFALLHMSHGTEIFTTRTWGCATPGTVVGAAFFRFSGDLSAVFPTACRLTNKLRCTSRSWLVPKATSTRLAQDTPLANHERARVLTSRDCRRERTKGHENGGVFRDEFHFVMCHM